MKLHLTNGYPYPFPIHLPDAEQQAINDRALGTTLTLDGVKSFEWKDELTVEFYDYEAFRAAQIKTKWGAASSLPILTALTSEEEGYMSHPAIVVRDMAYCGFFIEPSNTAVSKHLLTTYSDDPTKETT